MPNFVHETPRWTIYRFATTISATGTVVAAVASRKIRIMSLFISPVTANNVKMQSSTTSDLTKLLYLPSSMVPLVLPHNPFGWMETVAGELLGADLSASVATTFGGTYVLV